MNKHAYLYIIICFFLITLPPIFSQQNDEELRGTLIRIENIPSPSTSGDGEFWDLVRQGKTIIPQLTKLLTDTAQTQASVPEIGGKYTVADAAYAVLTVMIPGVPTESFIPKKWQADSNYYWEYVRADIENRKTLRYEFTQWYNRNRDNITPADTVVFQTANRDSLPACNLLIIPPADSTRWISLSYGIGGSGFGFLNRFAISRFDEKHIYTLRFIRAEEFTLCFENCDISSPPREISEFSLLLGNCSLTPTGLTALSFGLSACTGIDRGKSIGMREHKEVHFATLGLTTEAVMIIAKPGWIGYTFSLYGNLNMQHSYIGWSLGLAFRSCGDK